MKHFDLVSLKKIFKAADHDPSKIVRAPHRDWTIVVAAFFFLLVVLIGAHVYLSIGLDREAFFSSDTQPAPVAFDKDKLIRTAAFYDARAAQFDAVKAQAPALVDPGVAQ